MKESLEREVPRALELSRLCCQGRDEGCALNSRFAEDSWATVGLLDGREGAEEANSGEARQWG